MQDRISGEQFQDQWSSGHIFSLVRVNKWQPIGK